MSETAARLVVRQGPYPDQEYILSQPVTVMGRGPNNDIVFADPEISRQHAQIILEAGADVYILKDLGSTNGSFVNGLRVSGTAPLGHGDTLNLGESIVLTFLLPGVDFYDEDETPTAELVIQESPAPQFEMAADPTITPLAENPDAPYFPPATGEAFDLPATNGRRGRILLIGCGVLLLLVFICMASLFFLDAYDNGSLLYCGGLRPLWDTLLGPFGFAPLCG